MMKYSETHEWIDVKGQIGTVGITDYAQNQLGEIVYVELPEVGTGVDKGEEVAVLESTKAAADVYSPVSGVVVEVNKELNEASELVNQSPIKNGWLFKIKLTDPDELDDLMDEDDYKAIT
jgi:glycine cleavage system H protein